MKTSRYFAAVLALAFAPALSAQTSYDAARALGEELNGSARYVGMGGAMGAFGNDLSVISKNPAGIGAYKGSDVCLTTSFFSTANEMDRPGISNGLSYHADKSKSDLNISLDNFAFVISDDTSDGNLNFAFAYRRVRDLDRVINYMDDFNDQEGYLVYRDYMTSESNRINAFDFNLSGSSNNRFYWGLTMSLYDLRYQSDGYFYDYYPEQPGYANSTDYTALDRMNDVYGHGWNAKLGFIYRPAAGPLRLGVSVATPQMFRLREEYSDKLYALMGEEKDGSAFNQNIDFKVTGPWTLNASAGISAARNALGVEYEISNYNETYMKVDGLQKTNQGGLDMQTMQTMRVGYETNIDKISLRAGFVHSTPLAADNAYKFLGSYNDAGIFIQDGEFNGSRCDFDFENLKNVNTWTVGLGYCSSPDNDGIQFYLDAAYARTIRHSVLCMSEYDDDPVVPYTDRTGKFLVTMGFSF